MRRVQPQGGFHVQLQLLAGQDDSCSQAHGAGIQIEIAGLEALQFDDGGVAAAGIFKSQAGIGHIECGHVQCQRYRQRTGGIAGCRLVPAALRVVLIQLRVAEHAGVHPVGLVSARNPVIQSFKIQSVDGHLAGQQRDQLQAQSQGAHPGGGLILPGQGQADILQGYACPGHQPQADIAPDHKGGAGLLPEHRGCQLEDSRLVQQQGQQQQRDHDQRHGCDDEQG